MLAAIIDSLIRSIERLKQREEITEWGDYYGGTNYSAGAAAEKADLVEEFLRETVPFHILWDMGANDGRYSRLALKYGAQVVAFDIDPVAVSRNYAGAKKTGEPLLPLLLDLTAPSPAVGFANAERKTITGRRTPDVTLMLAVIHHLAISNNLPFDMIAAYLASFTPFLIIEFVPKTDSQVQRLLRTRIDIFTDYRVECFEAAFDTHFELLRRKRIENTERTLYLFRKKPCNGV
jgi:ribosomal protein L11 methylase PrmA